MKQADVVIGNEYATKIGESLARVVVTGKRDGFQWSQNRNKSRDVFTVRRVGESKDLPKARTAAALREIKRS